MSYKLSKDFWEAVDIFIVRVQFTCARKGIEPFPLGLMNQAPTLVEKRNISAIS